LNYSAEAIDVYRMLAALVKRIYDKQCFVGG
jgi:hypothetical protein